MVIEMLKSTPWWVWGIIMLAVVMIVGLSIVMPTVMVARTAPPGSQERAFVYRWGLLMFLLMMAIFLLSLLNPLDMGFHSIVFLIGIGGLSYWGQKRQREIRKEESGKRSSSSQQ